MSDQAVNLHLALQGVQLGVGTWAWGDRLFWGYGGDYTDEDLKEAFEANLAAGINFFDTAEVYGQGKSEQLLGRFIQTTTEPVKVATKFFPFPWRLTRSALVRALRGSLARLQLKQIDLYQIHQPWPPINVETWMEGMTEAFQLGLTKAVGVSNYDRRLMQRAYDALIREGIRLASNQVEFSLINRKIEKDGLLKQCQEMGIVCIAYSPMGLGLLSGKYTPQSPPSGMRGGRVSRKSLAEIQPLVAQLRKIGADHAGKTPSQVALNWVLCKGAVPIPGAKTALQAQQNAGALNWRLTEDEIALLDQMSDQLETFG